MSHQSVSALFPAQVRLPLNRHWSAESQTYASGDVLINYLRNGWQLDPESRIDKVSSEGPRGVDVFYFRLLKGQQMIDMPVIGSPRVYRLVDQVERELLQALV
jgi:hypothetical protein